MWLQTCTTRLCQLLYVSLILIRFTSICSQQIENKNRIYARQIRSYSEYTPTHHKYSQTQSVNLHDEDNKDRRIRSNNYRQQKPESDENEDDENNYEIDDTVNNEKLSLSNNKRSHGHNSHKCQIWVPIEAVDKYKFSRDIQAKDDLRQLKQLEVCCKGFDPVRFNGNTNCVPHCENCRNGHCIALNECECYKGFVKNDNGDCVFECPLGCQNGLCYLDRTCQCNPGYKLDETRKFCRPICSMGCNLLAGQNCTQPEVCGCAKGFQLKKDGCQRVCDPDCGIGGKCNEFNTCECIPGYKLKDDVCQSECYQSCDNGICVSRNRCICNTNYQYHERSTMCIPI